jgi:GNAT superfamily N-acetyltransferase
MAVIRPMQIADIELGMILSNGEGWNQTEKDWEFLIEHPENICLLAEADSKVIGTTTAINYSNEIAWVGMVLVDKNYRRMGVSTSLLTNILKKLESCKSIKLDATPAGQQVYKNFGFEDEYVITRMTIASMKSLSKYDETDVLPEQIQFKDMHAIAAFDQHIFGANRIQLIKYLK